MPPAQRKPRVVNRVSNPNLLKPPVIEDEPGFVPPKSTEESSVRDEIKEATDIPYNPGKYYQPLMQLYGVAAVGLMPFLPRTSVTLASSAEKCVEEWEKLARRNPQVKRILDMVTQNTGRFAVAAAHAPIFVAAARETGTTDRIMKSNAVQKLLRRFMPKETETEYVA